MDELFPRIWFTREIELDKFEAELSDINLLQYGLQVRLLDSPASTGSIYIMIESIENNQPYLAIYKSEGERGIEIGYYSNEKTYDGYVAGAEKILIPVTLEYKKKYKKTLNYRTQSKKELMFVFPPKSEKAYKTFIASANKQSLHFYDWGRLYRLARVCHSTRVKPSEMDFIRLLLNEGFEEDYAEHVGTIFHHCLELLDS